MLRYFGRLVAISIVCLSIVHERPDAQARPVPATAVDAARRGDVRAVVEILVRSGVSGGAVIPAPALRKPPDVHPVPPERVTSLEEVAVAFRGVGRNRVAMVERGGIFASDGESKCLTPLRKELSDLRLRGPLHIVGHQLMRMVNPTISGAPPTLMNRTRRPGPSLAEEPVSLFYQQITVQEALDDIVRQLPGAFWVFAEDEHPDTKAPRCTLNWFLRDGSRTSTSYDLFPKKPMSNHRLH